MNLPAQEYLCAVADPCFFCKNKMDQFGWRVFCAFCEIEQGWVGPDKKITYSSLPNDKDYSVVWVISQNKTVIIFKQSQDNITFDRLIEPKRIENALLLR